MSGQDLPEGEQILPMKGEAQEWTQCDTDDAMTSMYANDIINIFKIADDNGDGTISKQELKRVFNELGTWSDKEFDMLFKQADLNGDGALQYEEFVKWILKDEDKLVDKTVEYSMLDALFAQYDKDYSGKLCAKELQAFIEEHHDSEQSADIKMMQQYLKEADKNGDDEIDATEFVQYINRSKSNEKSETEPDPKVTDAKSTAKAKGKAKAKGSKK